MYMTPPHGKDAWELHSIEADPAQVHDKVTFHVVGIT
jgi:hypothetical protein